MGRITTTARTAIFSLLFAVIVLYGGVAQAIELPFDYPASGSEILCYLNGLEEENGVPVRRPPIPTFDVGTCAETPSPAPTPEPTPSPEPAPAPAPLPECSNGSDDDGDGLTDSADPGCHTDFDASNTASYDPNGTNEAATKPQCSDGLDNDGDGKTDFPSDPGCSDASDNDETDPSSGGGGGGGGGGGKSAATTTGLVLGASTTTQFSTTTESCDRYLTAFIREGNDNDADQVKRLQRFLRDFEGASNVAETGIYDKVTLAAVHTFQTKYAADILAPWGIEESTGYVYLTTRKKVNEIVCHFTKTFPLTVDELKKIETARAAAFATPSVPATPQPVSPASVPSASAANTASTETSGNGALQSVFDFLQGVWERYR